MSEARHSQIWRTILVLTAVSLFAFPAQAKYSGGAGEPNDPYQIATAADLIGLGETPGDYDKHFILTADIDLDPNLPGRKIFDKAVIAPDTDPTKEYFQGTPFTGVFDGNGRIVSRLTVRGKDYVGLFGQLTWAEVKDVGVVDANVTGSGTCVGGLASMNFNSRVSQCYSTGTVGGAEYVGGLVGGNSCRYAHIASSYSMAMVSGIGEWSRCVGGLVGSNDAPDGDGCDITNSYSTGSVSGNSLVGGLVGDNSGWIRASYSIGKVSGTGWWGVGGLLGHSWGTATACFWDTQTSGQTTSAGGTGKTTPEMQTAATFLDAGWDFVGETVNGSEDIWKIAEGLRYPRLSWEKYSGGTGEPNDPYQIATATDLMALGETPADYDKHFVLTADIDLDPNLPGRKVFDKAVIAPDVNAVLVWYWDPFDGTPFTGAFDGNGHTISHLTIIGGSYVGLFGQLGSGNWACVSNVGLHAIGVRGTGHSVGGLAGSTYNASITACCSSGSVSGDYGVGGLVGDNIGTVITSYSSASVTGDHEVGGLVGDNSYDGRGWGSIFSSYSTGAVRGTGWSVGGLVGINCGDITASYSTSLVSGTINVGGLIGDDCCHDMMGGCGHTEACFWDIQTSGQSASAGGAGETTAEMQTAKTFLEAGWDFVGETANGEEDIWWILEGKDYPRLWWEARHD